MSLEFHLDHRDDLVAIGLTGRIDRDAGDVLARAYAAAAAVRPDAIELDFGEVEYINSTGIALIVGLLARARADRITVRALGLTDHYRHIFEITRLSDFIEIVQSVGQ